MNASRCTLIGGAIALLASHLAASPINIISTETNFTWSWSEQFLDLNTEGTWEGDEPVPDFRFDGGGSITQHNPAVIHKSFITENGVAYGTGIVGPFQLDVFNWRTEYDNGQPPYPRNWYLLGGYVHTSASATTLFRPTSDSLDFHVLGHAWDPWGAWGEWDLSLVDHTTGDVLVTDSLLNGAPYEHDLRDYTLHLEVDPSHTYTLELTGFVNTTFYDLGNRTDVRAWFTSAAVPDGGATIALLGVGLTVLGLTRLVMPQREQID